MTVFFHLWTVERWLLPSISNLKGLTNGYQYHLVQSCCCHDGPKKGLGMTFCGTLSSWRTRSVRACPFLARLAMVISRYIYMYRCREGWSTNLRPSILFRQLGSSLRGQWRVTVWHWVILCGLGDPMPVEACEWISVQVIKLQVEWWIMLIIECLASMGAWGIQTCEPSGSISWAEPCGREKKCFTELCFIRNYCKRDWPGQKFSPGHQNGVFCGQGPHVPYKLNSCDAGGRMFFLPIIFHYWFTSWESSLNFPNPGKFRWRIKQGYHATKRSVYVHKNVWVIEAGPPPSVV